MRSVIYRRKKKEQRSIRKSALTAEKRWKTMSLDIRLLYISRRGPPDEFGAAQGSFLLREFCHCCLILGGQDGNKV